MITRWQKAEVYVLVRVYEDLAGDWVIEKVSGRGLSIIENIESFSPLNYRESKIKFRQICMHLRTQGFRAAKDDEVQLGFNF